MLLHDTSAPFGAEPVGIHPAPLRALDGSLLPPNATTFERIMEKTAAGIYDAPIAIGDLWNPEKCPAQFLPHLAWGLNVDLWDPDWPEKVKRQVLAEAIQSHWKKGTIKAVKSALNAIGITALVKEWHELDPQGEPGTFEIQLILRDDIETASPEVIDQARIDAALGLVDRVKRQSQHYTVSTGIEGRLSAAVVLAQSVSTAVAQAGELSYTHDASGEMGVALAGRIQTTFFHEGEL